MTERSEFHLNPKRLEPGHQRSHDLLCVLRLHGAAFIVFYMVIEDTESLELLCAVILVWTSVNRLVVRVASEVRIQPIQFLEGRATQITCVGAAVPRFFWSQPEGEYTWELRSHQDH